MKSLNLINPMNGEKFICDDIRMIETIDGVEYIHVRRPHETRQFKMRKDALKKDMNIKKKSYS